MTSCQLNQKITLCNQILGLFSTFDREQTDKLAFTVANPGYSRRGSANLRLGCASLLFGQIFAKNCTKMKEIGSGGCVPSAPLDPPMLMNVNEGPMFKLGKCSVMQWLSYWSWKIPTCAVDLNFPHGYLSLQSGHVTWAKI